MAAAKRMEHGVIKMPTSIRYVPCAMLSIMVQIERTEKPPATGFKIIGTWLGQVANPGDPPQNWKMSQQRVPEGLIIFILTLKAWPSGQNSLFSVHLWMETI